MKRTLLILLVNLCVLSAFGQERPAAILEYFDSPTEIRITDADGFQVANPAYGQEVPSGATLRTLAGSAELRLIPSGSIIKLSRNSIFKIESIQGVRGSTKNAFNLAAGKIRTVAARLSGADYEFRTPAAVCGVRGTDFGLEVIAGSREAVFVKEGLVEFARTGGRTIRVAAGQTADVFAATFQAVPVNAAELAGLYADLEFSKLDPAGVPRPAPSPTQAAQPADRTPATAETQGQPGPLDPIFDLIRNVLGIEIGSMTIDGLTYSKIIFQPTFRAERFVASFYLPIIYSGDMFDSHDWYRPRGNDEWSFGSDYDWLDDPSEAAWDLGRDLALKIRYIEWGKQRDPFYFRIGNVPSMTLGHGSIVRGYRNDVDFPAVRRVGFNLGVDTGPFGVEGILNDLAEPEIFGARFFFRPAPTATKLAFGLTAVTDIDPAGDLPDEPAFDLARDVDPLLLAFGADVDYPLIEGDLASMIGFIDVAAMVPYLRGEFGLSKLGTQGFVGEAVFYDGGTKLRNYGIMAGVLGNFAVMDYRLEFRQFHGLFRPGFYGATYDRLRGGYAAEILGFLSDPSNPKYDRLTMGIYGEAGFNLVETFRFEAGYLWPWRFEDGEVEFDENDFLFLSAVAQKGLIPLEPFSGLSFSFYYSRERFIYGLLQKEEFELLDANAVLRGEIVYPIAPTLDVAMLVTTTVLRNGDGSVRLDDDGQPEWAPSLTIETRVHF